MPGQEILCIACLERRIGRTLMKCDFTDVPVNDLKHGSWHRSVRLIDRLMPLGEYYMVKDDVWKQAWAGYRKSYPVVPVPTPQSAQCVR